MDNIVDENKMNGGARTAPQTRVLGEWASVSGRLADDTGTWCGYVHTGPDAIALNACSGRLCAFQTLPCTRLRILDWFSLVLTICTYEHRWLFQRSSRRLLHVLTSPDRPFRPAAQHLVSRTHVFRALDARINQQQLWHATVLLL